MDKINNIYDNLTYFDLYFGNIFLFVFLILALFAIFTFSYVMANTVPIKQNLTEERCKPQNILFAGIINKPDNETIFEYTGENFTYCIQNILGNITGIALEPFTVILSAIVEVYEEIAIAIDSIRTIISTIRTNIIGILTEIFDRILNVIVPIQRIFIAFKDSLAKINGIIATAFMTFLGTYMTLQTLMGSILEFIIIILIILAIMALFFPMYSIVMIIFLAISIPLAIICIFMSLVLQVHVDGIPSFPSPPACFDENTYIQLNNGFTKQISDICVGDILMGGNIVNAKIKLSSKGQQMYRINNIYVSGTHRIVYNNEWIFVADCPIAHRVHNYFKSYLYCLNTDKKIIPISNMIFCDWDEVINDTLMDKLFKKIEIQYNLINVERKTQNINKYLDTGFIDTTLIPMKNGKKEFIDYVNVGDKLLGGQIVCGIVCISNKGNINNINDVLYEENKNPVLYNLITNGGKFYVYNPEKKINEIVMDYNNNCNIE